MKSIYWDESDKGTTYEYKDIPKNLEEEAQRWRHLMIESAAEADERILERYLEEDDLSEEDILHGLRARTINGEIIVTSCGSAFKNIGVQLLLDLSLIHI